MLVVAAGSGGSGALGTGDCEDASAGRVLAWPGGRLRALASGGRHSLALIEDPDGGDACVFGTGSNESGELGFELATSMTPRLQRLPWRPPGTPVVAIACGWAHSLAVDTSGALWTWGSNAWGQLGRATPASSTADPTPRRVALGAPATRVAGGFSHSLAEDVEGTVWGWGDSKFGALGAVPSASRIVSEPRRVERPDEPAGGGSGAEGGGRAEDPVEGAVLACGKHLSAHISWTGRLRVWGDNRRGQCPPSATLATLSCMSVACGWTHVLALDRAGRVHAWGRNDMGQLGRATDGPAVVEGFGESTHSSAASGVGVVIAEIAAGTEHSVARTLDGQVFVWGWNEHGNLAVGDCETRDRPVLATRLVPSSPPSSSSPSSSSSSSTSSSSSSSSSTVSLESLRASRVWAGGAATFVELIPS